MSTPTPNRGTLAEVGLLTLLRPLLGGKKTGVLRFTRGSINKTVYVSDGHLIFATSNDPDDRLGEMLLRKGTISFSALEESSRALQAGKRQGTILVESGAIRSRDLVDGVMEQVQEIIYDLFTWEDGDFEFSEGTLPSREVIVLRISTEDIIMEGARRVQRWSRIRNAVGEIHQRYRLSPRSAAILGGMSLTKQEVNLIASIDEVSTVEEICAAIRQSDFWVCRTIWGLWAVGILDRDPQDIGQEHGAEDKTKPRADRLRGVAVGTEIERLNEIHRFLFELVTYELRERAQGFFERAFAKTCLEHPTLFEGVAVDTNGELDPIALRRNIVSNEIATYARDLDRLVEIETDLTREMLGERKAAIILDGI
ncbi:MAG: DUF4388 domain-containing protein, partial [Vicinamibacteria bacterium]|nr:DUF4388 domain-containing protein [Vicinamibacteria bacterium]